MSSARVSNWRPQPPNLQELEKKEAAAMPVMFSALVHSPGGEVVREGGGGDREPGEVSEEVEIFGVGAPQSAEQTPVGQTGQRRTQLGGSRDGGGGDGGGRGLGYVTTCLPVGMCAPAATVTLIRGL